MIPLESNDLERTSFGESGVYGNLLAVLRSGTKDEA